MRLPKFLVGLLIGGMIGSIYWYYQKSTSAEDGALSVLDRLAASEAKVRDLEAQLRKTTPQPATPEESKNNVNLAATPVKEESARDDDLQQIEGIGPTYARRLQEAGIVSYGGLAAMTPQQVMEITAARSTAVAEAWIKAAHDRIAG